MKRDSEPRFSPGSRSRRKACSETSKEFMAESRLLPGHRTSAACSAPTWYRLRLSRSWSSRRAPAGRDRATAAGGHLETAERPDVQRVTGRGRRPRPPRRAPLLSCEEGGQRGVQAIRAAFRHDEEV